jgi:hypothetical protein
MLEKVGFVVDSTYDFAGKEPRPQNNKFSVVASKPITYQ